MTTSCERYTADLSLDQQVGQLFMVGTGADELSGREAERLAELRVGSVILLQNRTAGREAIHRLTRELRAAAELPSGLELLLAVDQEGGKVQRLRGPGFDDIPAAPEQAELSDAELSRQAARWGEQLRAAGIDADLAPVADVVPAELGTANRPVGLLRRGYGSDPDVVAAKVAAFVRGMSEAGVATAVKHYPGLGRVRGNTDYERRVVDRSTTRRSDDLRGFPAAVAAGVDMVMMSSAYYARIDADRQAAFSPAVLQEMVRGDLGFEGVVISDDLAARALTDFDPGDRALRFLGAGGDLVIVGDPELAPEMVRAARSQARDDQEFADRVRASATRVVAMKARRGLADCGT